jgi:PAS domain-containing protein
MPDSVADPFARLRELSEPGAILDPDLLANLIEALPDAIFVVDAKATIRLVNAAAELLFGYHRIDLHGQPIHR